MLEDIVLEDNLPRSGGQFCGLEEGQGVGAGNGFRARGDLELLQDVAEVRFGGALRDNELVGDLLVGCPAHQQLQHLNLARGEGFARAGNGNFLGWSGSPR